MTTESNQGPRATSKFSDLANAEHLVKFHGANLKFIAAWGKWLIWEGTRWQLDEGSTALRLAADTMRAMLASAFALEKASAFALEKLELEGADEKAIEEAGTQVAKAEAAVSWAKQSQNAARLRAMVDLAKCFAEIGISHKALDADQWVLNVANGTVDLCTGELRPHNRADLITKLAPVHFDMTAECPTWKAFLFRAMAERQDLVDYLGRLAGYGLTGSIREHVLAFFYGAGSNGKSTYVSTVHHVMGDYAVRAPRGLLFQSKGERHPTELTCLYGARFVSCSEIEEDQSFDEALMKDITGGDPIAARRMREDFWEFLPTHKIGINGNYKPVIHGDDDGVWRRMRLIPWTVRIPDTEKDEKLPEKLQAEASGILRWMVEGCLIWQRDKLGDPPAVIEATAAYREDSDPMRDFFETRCIFGEACKVSRRTLRLSYEAWCKESGNRPYGARKFTAALRKRGISKETTVQETDRTWNETMRQFDRKSVKRDGWEGIRLTCETPEEEAALKVADATKAALPPPPGASPN